MISKGDRAPAFCLPDKDGTSVCLNDFSTPFTLVYFYPEDNTPGCSLEANGFQALKKEFEKQGVSIIGISGGDEKSKEEFCTQHGLDLLLVSDKDFAVSTEYGVYKQENGAAPQSGEIMRSSFLLDKDKTVIESYEDVDPKEHPKHVLQIVKELNGKK